MSGDLRDAQKSIPAGTILAQLTCSFIFISLVFLYAGTTQQDVIRDKYTYTTSLSIIWLYREIALAPIATRFSVASSVCLSSVTFVHSATVRRICMQFGRYACGSSDGRTTRRSCLVVFTIQQQAVVTCLAVFDDLFPAQMVSWIPNLTRLFSDSIWGLSTCTRKRRCLKQIIFTLVTSR